MGNMDFWRGPLAVLTLLAICGTFYAVSSQNVKKREVATLHHAALESLERANPREAIRLLQDSLELYPDNAELHLALAMVYSNHKREAADFLGLDLPDLYQWILDESDAACRLLPESLDMARHHAYFTMDASGFDASVDMDEAFRAWKRYLRVHRENEPDTEYTWIVHNLASYSILNRLATIERERGNVDSAAQYARSAASFKRTIGASNKVYTDSVVGLRETE